MLRFVHSIAGLLAAVLTSILAVTGAILSVEPAIERASVSLPPRGQVSVASVAALAAGKRGEVERIVRSPTGSIIVHRMVNGSPRSERIDAVSGAVQPIHTVSAFSQFVRNLHRSILLGETGRAAAGIGALCMLILSISGLIMLANRFGGWRAVFRRIRGTRAQRWHGELARAAVLGLLISCMTAIYLSLATFEFISDGMVTDTTPPRQVRGGLRLPPARLHALRAVDIDDLRELQFPQTRDLTDVYRLTTAHGIGQIDAATGAMLAFEPHSIGRQVYETIYMLHTGQGMWQLALALGLAALAVPVLSVTGTLIWWRRRRSSPRIKNNAGAQSADTIILVGSEGGSTWAFAATLHAALTQQGYKVHAAPMNAMLSCYQCAERILFLASTYGDGAVPASGSRLLNLITRYNRALPFAVLGFGDRSFPKFCRFAEDTEAALEANGWPALLPMGRIDRQSAQAFAQWGEALGHAIGKPLVLDHAVARPKSLQFSLFERADYGQEVQAPTTVFRFMPPQQSAKTGALRRIWWRNPKAPQFAAGDLVGVLPPGSNVPRYYSLASSSEDGFLEICVRKQPGGLCSGYLHGLQPGEAIDAFIKPNPIFRPARGKSPLILIGAGAGIGPLVGIVRQNSGHRPIHLYWGGRHPSSDFLYEGDLSFYLTDKRLTRFRSAFSRVARGLYVQDRISLEANAMRDLIKSGAQVMVCGGRDMASSVASVVDGIVRPIGLDLSRLKAEGRYVEDVY